MKESKLVLGCVQFGLKYGIANTKGQVSSQEVRNILQKAFEQGTALWIQLPPTGKVSVCWVENLPLCN